MQRVDCAVEVFKIFYQGRFGACIVGLYHVEEGLQYHHGCGEMAGPAVSRGIGKPVSPDTPGIVGRHFHSLYLDGEGFTAVFSG